MSTVGLPDMAMSVDGIIAVGIPNSSVVSRVSVTMSSSASGMLKSVKPNVTSAATKAVVSGAPTVSVSLVTDGVNPMLPTLNGPRVNECETVGITSMAGAMVVVVMTPPVHAGPDVALIVVEEIANL